MVIRINPNVFVLLLFIFSTVLAQDGQYHQLTLQGIDYAYNMQSEKATEVFDEIIKLDPNNPLGYVLQSVNYYYRMQLEENYHEFEEKFKEFASKAIKISKKNLSDKQKRLEALFYLGTTHMYLAGYHGERNNWFPAFRYGKAGIDYLKKVVAMNPQYYDAYLGLGLYHYYADVMPKFVKAITFLLGIEADRKEGLHELEIAAEKGLYSKAEAMLFLGNIYLYIEKDYEKSLTYFEKLAHRYPKSPGYLVLLGENHQKLGNHSLAIESFNKVIKEDNFRRFPGLIMFTSYQLGNAYFELNKFEEAIVHYSQTIKYSLHYPEKRGNRFSAWANYKIGECYEILGRRERAINYYKKVKKSYSKQAHKLAQERLKKPLLTVEIDIIRGRNYFTTKQYDKALNIYEEAISRVKENTDDYPNQKLPELHYNLGKALYENKLYQEAISEFSKILAIEKIKEEWIKPWTHFRLGHCYKEIGNLKKAMAEYEIAYKYDDSELKFEIEKIREKLKSEFVEN